MEKESPRGRMRLCIWLEGRASARSDCIAAITGNSVHIPSDHCLKYGLDYQSLGSNSETPETDLPCREREPPAQRAGRRSYGRSLADPDSVAEPYFAPCPLHRFRIRKKADEI